jgi:hypothetical protein
MAQGPPSSVHLVCALAGPGARIKPVNYNPGVVMPRALVLCCLCACACATPAYFASVANQALKLQGGAHFGTDLSVQAVRQLEVQVLAVSPA